MPDGILPPTETSAPELAAETADSRLLRHVRRNLVLWSGGTTLLILIALAIALYVAAAGSLETAGIAQLDARMATIKGERPDPDDTSRYGFIFGGGGSGTYAMILDPNGQPVLSPRDPPVPAGLPYEPGIQAATTSGRDVRTTVIGGTPIRVLSETVVVPQRGTFTVQVVQTRRPENRRRGAIQSVCPA